MLSVALPTNQTEEPSCHDSILL